MDAVTAAIGAATGGPVGIAMALGQFVPGILKLFGGSDKTVEIATHVVGVAQAVTGTGTPQEAMTALQADPAKVLDFQQAMAAQQVDLEKAYLAEMGNSRAMQVAALAQDDLFSKRFVYYFAAAWSLFTMFYAWAITFWPPTTEAGKTNAATILGFLLGTAVASIFAYFFGSTKNSAEKTRLLAARAPQ